MLGNLGLALQTIVNCFKYELSVILAIFKDLLVIIVNLWTEIEYFNTFRATGYTEEKEL